MAIVQELVGTQIHGTIRNGHFEPDEPLDLPEAARVSVDIRIDKAVSVQKEAEGRPLTPEEYERLKAEFASILPFERTPEEEARSEADRLARKEWEKAHFFERAEKIEKMFH